MSSLADLLYPEKLPVPRHGHCGFPMVKGPDGFYYCKHCKDLARAEALPYTEEYRIKHIIKKSSIPD